MTTYIQKTLEEFDNEFPIINIGRDIKFNEISGKEIIKSFIINSHISYLQEENVRLKQEIKYFAHISDLDWQDGFQQAIESQITHNTTQIQLLTNGK